MKLYDRLQELWATVMPRLGKEHAEEATRLYGLAMMKQSSDWPLFESSLLSDMSRCFYAVLGASQAGDDAATLSMARKLNVYMELYAGPGVNAKACLQLLERWAKEADTEEELSKYNDRPQIRRMGGAL